jgi:hypothetical protein
MSGCVAVGQAHLLEEVISMVCRYPRGGDIGLIWGLIARRFAVRILPNYPVRAHVDVLVWLTTRALRCDGRCTRIV